MRYTPVEPGEGVMIAPGAAVIGDVRLGKDCSVWYNAVLLGNEAPITVGARSNVQDCAVLHNGTVLGSGVTVGHGAVVHGCTVGNDTLIGMGAIVLSGARIGRDCIVGAGALVTGKTRVPDGSMVLGNPAKVTRALTSEERQMIRGVAQEHVDAAREFLAERG